MEESWDNNTMKITLNILLVFLNHINKILSDRKIIVELQNFGVITGSFNDEMLAKRTLTIMVQKGILILDHTETWPYYDRYEVQHFAKHRFFRAKNSSPSHNIQKPKDATQKQLELPDFI